MGNPAEEKPGLARKPDVERELELLHEAIDHTKRYVGNLGERLKGVLRVQAGTGEEAKCGESLVPVAENIRAATQKLRRCNDDIQGMIDSCEL